MTLTDSLKTHWPSYRWAYAFIVWFVLGSYLADWLGYGYAFFVVSLPIFFVAFAKSVSPSLQGSVPYFHTVFWAVLGPFLCAALLAMLRQMIIHVFAL